MNNPEVATHLKLPWLYLTVLKPNAMNFHISIEISKVCRSVKLYHIGHPGTIGKISKNNKKT